MDRGKRDRRRKKEILLKLYLSGTLNRETVLKELNITNSEFDKLFEDYKQLV